MPFEDVVTMCVEPKDQHKRASTRRSIERTDHNTRAPSRRTLSRQDGISDISDFHEEKLKLGEGAFGIVWLVKHKKSGECFALKEQSRKDIESQADYDRFLLEKRFMTEAQSNWIARWLAIFEDSVRIYTVMEFIHGVTLDHCIKHCGKLSEDNTRFYMAELLEAISAVHQYGYIHRDIKPENMMLDSGGHLKLLDFGLCAKAEVSVRKRRTFCGTIAYMAPELASGDDYGSAVDIWSHGVVTYECLIGKPPLIQRGCQASENSSGVRIRGEIAAQENWMHDMLSKEESAQRLSRDAAAYLKLTLRDEGSRLTLDQCRKECFFKTIDFENMRQCPAPLKPEWFPFYEKIESQRKNLEKLYPNSDAHHGQRKDVVIVTVEGAGCQGASTNGKYTQVGTHNAHPKFKQINGDCVILFRGDWCICQSDEGGELLYTPPSINTKRHLPDVGYLPPVGQWMCNFIVQKSFSSHGKTLLPPPRVSWQLEALDNPRCPWGHELIGWLTDCPDICCDSCHFTYPARTPMFSCASCKYHKCGTCLDWKASFPGWPCNHLERMSTVARHGSVFEPASKYHSVSEEKLCRSAQR